MIYHHSSEQKRKGKVSERMGDFIGKNNDFVIEQPILPLATVTGISTLILLFFSNTIHISSFRILPFGDKMKMFVSRIDNGVYKCLRALLSVSPEVFLSGWG